MKNGLALWVSMFAVLVLCLLVEGVGAALELPELLLVGSLSSFIIASLCIIDSQRVGKRLPLSTHWLFLLVPVVPVVAYAFWSRGWKGGALLFGLTLVALAANFFAFITITILASW